MVIQLRWSDSIVWIRYLPAHPLREVQRVSSLTIGEEIYATLKVHINSFCFTENSSPGFFQAKKRDHVFHTISPFSANRWLVYFRRITDLNALGALITFSRS
jgi:hypothetical protein